MLDTTMQQRRTDSLLTSERKKPFISVGGSSFQPRMALPYKQHDFNSTDMDLLLMGKRPTGFDSSGDFMKYTDYNIQTCSGLQSGSSPSGNSLDSGIATAVTNDCLNEPSPSLSSSVAPITVAPNVMHLKQVFENVSVASIFLTHLLAILCVLFDFVMKCARLITVTNFFVRPRNVS